MKFTESEALIATIAIGILMLTLRLLPFIIFAKRKTPAFFSFIEKFIPALSIAVLFIACLKGSSTDIIFSSLAPLSELPSMLCSLAAVLFTAILHIWKNNAMVSIFGGTILYMVLNYFF